MQDNIRVGNVLNIDISGFDERTSLERIMFNAIAKLRAYHNYGKRMDSIGKGFEPSNEISDKDLIAIMEADYRANYGELPDNETFSGPLL